MIENVKFICKKCKKENTVELWDSEIDSHQPNTDFNVKCDCGTENNISDQIEKIKSL